MEPPEYFASYESYKIHDIMLKDSIRNTKYRQAIMDNAGAIKGKVVLDVGAGSGILSVFCAQAGAAKVYSVEASNFYKIAQSIAKENNFENVIEVIHGRIEEVNIPEKVDVIVSEWMGFYLFHEAMLNSVIIARDKYLKSEGLIFPETATLYSAPCSVPSMYDYYTNVNGISMTSFAEELRKEVGQEPMTVKIQPDHLLSEPEVVSWINLKEVTCEDVSIMKIQHVAVAKRCGKYQGVCLWFECSFPSTYTEPVLLTTAPEEPETHWKQTVILLPYELEVEDGEPIAYELCLTREADADRRYQIQVTMLDAETVDHPEDCKCHLTKCILVRAMLEKYENDS